MAVTNLRLRLTKTTMPGPDDHRGRREKFHVEIECYS